MALQGHLFKAAFVKKVPLFLQNIGENVVLCLAASAIEATSKRCLTLIDLQWQKALTARVHKYYFQNMVRRQRHMRQQSDPNHSAERDAVAVGAVDFTANYSLILTEVVAQAQHTCVIFETSRRSSLLLRVQTYYKLPYVDHRITNPEQRICEGAPQILP